jgi:hypothetical protein
LHQLHRQEVDKILRFTVWNPVFQAVIYTLWVLLVLGLELGFARLSVSTREDIGHQFIILAELREGLRRIRYDTRCDTRILTA